MWQVLQIFIPLCRVQSSNDHSSNSVPQMKTGTQSISVGGPFRQDLLDVSDMMLPHLVNFGMYQSTVNIVLCDPAFISKPLADALKILRTVCYETKPFDSFFTQTLGKAKVLEFRIPFNAKCMNCNTATNGAVYYMDEVIWDMLLNGIKDSDICHEALSTDRVRIKPVSQVITFAESREMVPNVSPSMLFFLAMSTYYQSYNGCPNQRHGIVGWSGLLIAADCSKTSKFTDCGGTFNLYTRKSRGWNQRSYKQWKLLKEDSKRKTYFWLQLKNKQWLVGTDIRYQSGCSPWASDL